METLKQRAFIKTAPPTVPGKPAKTSAPLILFFVQKFTKLAIVVPQKQEIKTLPSGNSIFPKDGGKFSGGKYSMFEKDAVEITIP